jgi:hypothetical protein
VAAPPCFQCCCHHCGWWYLVLWKSEWLVDIFDGSELVSESVNLEDHMEYSSRLELQIWENLEWQYGKIRSCRRARSALLRSFVLWVMPLGTLLWWLEESVLVGGGLLMNLQHFLQEEESQIFHWDDYFDGLWCFRKCALYQDIAHMTQGGLLYDIPYTTHKILSWLRVGRKIQISSCNCWKVLS